MENNELFEGLQIMSPEELNQAVSSQNNGEAETNAGQEAQQNEPATLFTPVTTETGEGAGEHKEVPEKTETSPESLTKNEAVYKALMKELVNSGVLTVEEMEKLDELPGTLDTIKELVSKTVETGVKQTQENWKKNLDPTKKRFLEIEDAFDATDQAILMAQRLEFFDNVDQKAVTDDVNLQKQIYFELLKSKNFSDQDAIEAINDAEQMGKLQEKSLKAIPELRKQAHEVVEHARLEKETKTKAK